MAAEFLELARVTQELDQFAHFFLGFFDSGDVSEGYFDLVFALQLGAALAERHRTSPGAAANEGFDLKGVLREGVTDQGLRNAIVAIWQQRADRYSEIRTAATARVPKVEMSYIGG